MGRLAGAVRGQAFAYCIAYIETSGDHTAGSFWAPASGIVYRPFCSCKVSDQRIVERRKMGPGESPRGRLLSAICVNGSYEKEKGLQASLRVLWLKLWSMGEEEQTEPPKESKTEAAAKSRDKAETAKETKAEKSKTEQQKTEQPKAESKVQTETEHTAEPKTQTQSKAGPEKTAEKKSSTKPEAKPETKPVQKQEKAIKVAEADQEEDKIEPAEKKSHQWIRKINAFLEKLKFSFKHFCDKLKDIKTFVREKREWLEDEEESGVLKTAFYPGKKASGTCMAGLGKRKDPFWTG